MLSLIATVLFVVLGAQATAQLSSEAAIPKAEAIFKSFQ